MKKHRRERPETTSAPQTTKVFAISWNLGKSDTTELDAWLNADLRRSIVGVAAAGLTGLFIVTRGPQS